MQTLDDMNETSAHLLQRLSLLISEHEKGPEISRKTLSQCEAELCTLRSVQKRLERRVASVCRQRNTFIPINALPSELLVTIFMTVIHDGWAANYSDHATLALVCYRWNHLVNDTPSLWTQIRNLNGTSRDTITRALANSKDAPLGIVCSLSWGGGHGEQNAFLDAVFPHSHRWKEASLSLQGDTSRLEDLATLSLPLLESFSLSVDRDSAWARDQPLDIFGARPPPRLQELSLAGIPVPWDSKIFCQLTDLSLSRILKLGPSVDQVLTALSASPNLESLAIREVTFSGGASVMSPNPTHMPALNRMALCDLPTPTANRILRAIHAPKCKFGELSCTIQGNPFETLFTPDISHFFEHMRSRADTGSIACHSNSIMITWIGPWRINLNVDVAFTKDTINWLSTPMERGSRAVPLDLSIYGTQTPTVEGTLAAVADMELLHRVTLGPDIGIAGALTLLATCTSADGGARWSFPALEQLWIDALLNDEEWEMLLRALRARQGDSEGSGDGQQPKPLRRLEFREDWDTDASPMINNFSSLYWPNRLDEIRRLLGPKGELIWYGRAVALDGVLGDRPAFLWT